MGVLPPRCQDLRNIPLGATPVNCGCHFAVWAPYAKKVIVHLFDEHDEEIDSFVMNERRGGIWYGFGKNISSGARYALETQGIDDPSQGFYFKAGRLLVDPYAHILSKPFIYDDNLYHHDSKKFIPKCIVSGDMNDFDWENIGKPNLDRNCAILYELNVKGFTQLNYDIPPEYRGKYLGIAQPQVIAHLKKLGITAIQLNPVAASMSEPFLVEKGLTNYWGYNPVCFMCPDPKFAVKYENVLDEFRTMVKNLHRNNIAVILDVVYNHTAEGGRGGPVVCYKGFDNKHYYAFGRKEDGSIDYEAYCNFTGCGNSFNVDNTCSLDIVIDSMRWWLNEMKVDGFRFDLGATLFRESHGDKFLSFNKKSAFAKACFCLDEFSSAVLIAEPWDLGNDGYRLGQFPYNWSEQNDRFRDTVRRFWRGDKGLIGEFATRLLGSRDIFPKGKRSINSSVNFVSYHDGFTLEDLVSYAHKHNEANGEDNRDGSDNNYSCNYGVEGPTDDENIKEHRALIKRNLIATVFIAQGIPHILAGDEFSHSQQGNNNAYCQDNEISWIKWKHSPENEDFIRFISNMSLLRKNSEILSELNLEDDPFLMRQTKYQAHWFCADGKSMKVENWNDPEQNVVMLTVGSQDLLSGEQWVFLFNQSKNDIFFRIPEAPAGKMWSAVIDTYESDGVPRRFSNENHLSNVCAAHSLKALMLINNTREIFDRFLSHK